MWVEERNGRYKFVERYTDYLTGQKKRVSVMMDKNTAQSRKLAERTLNEMIQRYYAAPRDPKNVTLAELVKAYQEDQKKTVKPATYRRNYFASEALKKMLGGNTLVDRISAPYVRDRFLASQKEPSTLNEHLARFKAMIRWGYQNDYVENIAYLDKLGNFKDVPHKVKIQDKFLEADELRTLLANMKNDFWRNLTEFLALSGLRYGEAAALKKEDVDFENRMIYVRNNYDTINDVTTTPKTLCSIRDVYMQDELYDCCLNLKQIMLHRRLLHGIQDTHGLFLFDTKGDHIHYYTFNKYLKEHSEKVTGKAITPHALRHTHASLLMEHGVSVDVISRRLGHENSRVTREIYLHVTERLKEKDNEQLKEIQFL